MSSKAVWFSAAAPWLTCRDWSHIKFLDADSGRLQSAQALPGYLLSVDLPFPEAALILY